MELRARSMTFVLALACACVPSSKERVEPPREDPGATNLLATLDAAREDYSLQRYYSASRDFLARYPAHEQVDRVRYELATQLIAETITATTSTTTDEARRLLTAHAAHAKSDEQRFEAELLLLKLAPVREREGRATGILSRHPRHVDLDQVHLFMMAASQSSKDLATAARWARDAVARFPSHAEVERFRELVRRQELTVMPWDHPELAAVRKKYAGKVVLVDFFATWCLPCLQELPKIRAFREKHRGARFEVLGVSLDEHPRELEQFLAREELPWPVVRSDVPPSGVASLCGVTDLPTYVVLDREGRVVSKELRGPAMFEKIEALLTDERDGRGGR
jgi:thiol-disulfide isomerase/thioredoxin